MDVEHKKPPIKTIRMSTEEGIKVINVRRQKKPKVPPEPTGEEIRCPHCGDVHPMLMSKSHSRKLLTFRCPRIGHAVLYLKQEGQDYLKSLVIGGPGPRQETPVRKEPAREETPEAETDIPDDLIRSLREAIDG